MLKPPSPTYLSTRNCPSSTWPMRPKGSVGATKQTISEALVRSGTAVEGDASAADEAVLLERLRPDGVELEDRADREVAPQEVAEGPLVEDADAAERLRALCLGKVRVSPDDGPRADPQVGQDAQALQPGNE